MLAQPLSRGVVLKPNFSGPGKDWQGKELEKKKFKSSQTS